jgi:hypothetical protein
MKYAMMVLEAAKSAQIMYLKSKGMTTMGCNDQVQDSHVVGSCEQGPEPLSSIKLGNL